MWFITCSSRIIGANYLATPPELDSASDQKSDKRRNAPQLEGTHIEGLDTECHNIREEDKQEQGLLHGESVIKDLPPANGESWEQQRIEETSAEGIGTKCPNVDKEDELHVQGSRDADSMIIDMPAAHGEQQEQHIDKLVSSCLCFSSVVPLPNIHSSHAYFTKNQGEILTLVICINLTLEK